MQAPSSAHSQCGTKTTKGGGAGDLALVQLEPPPPLIAATSAEPWRDSANLLEANWVLVGIALAALNGHTMVSADTRFGQASGWPA